MPKEAPRTEAGERCLPRDPRAKTPNAVRSNIPGTPRTAPENHCLTAVLCKAWVRVSIICYVRGPLRAEEPALTAVLRQWAHARGTWKRNGQRGLPAQRFPSDLLGPVGSAEMSWRQWRGGSTREGRVLPSTSLASTGSKLENHRGLRTAQQFSERTLELPGGPRA